MPKDKTLQGEGVNKNGRLMVLGFDLGTSTGVAAYRNGVLTGLRTIKPKQMGALLDFCSQDGARVQVVFEDSRLQAALFTTEKTSIKNEKARLKVARDVGRIDGLGEWLQSLCEERKLPYLAVSPRDKGVKVAASAFEHHTGWAKRCNQHERDAAMVAKPFRKGFSA